MNIQHMRYAVEVARTGSITQAAENLYMGQPNLSKAIRELETGLGIRIFRRTSRGVIPTFEGDEFLHYARSVIAQVDKIESIYSAGRKPLTYYCLASTPSLYVSEAYAAFSAAVSSEYPEAMISLSYREQQRSALMDAVADGECSMGILRCRMDEEKRMLSLLARKELSARVLWRYPVRLFVSSTHPLTRVPAITRDMLGAYPRVQLSCYAGDGLTLFENEMEEEDSCANAITVSSRDSALAVLRCMPAAYSLCMPLREDVLRHYGMAQCAVEGAVCQYQELLVTRRGGALGRLDKLFIATLRDMQPALYRMPDVPAF